MTQKTLAGTELQGIQKNILKRLPELEGRKVIVVGDVGLDEYVMGSVSRISPEAPVPVLDVSEEDQRVGLAANVAQNIASLGGIPLLVGVVGDDAAADALKKHLAASQVSNDFLITDKTRPTTRKTRVMAEHHHLVRVDYEHRRFLSADVEAQLLEKVESLLPESDGVILQDYAKGVISERGAQNIIAMAHRAGKRVLVDPHRSTPLSYYHGADLFKPNRDEAFILSELNLDELREKKDSYLKVGETLMRRIGCQHLVMTRGKAGMTLFEKDEVVDLPTYARQVFDVTGAGDTVVAAIGLAWLSGLSLEEACVLGNFAAGVVVGKVGCVPCTVPELTEYMGR
ncbi:MAG: D-glycero-beta-D-manno-heptose-7-phosphate kinase [Pseudobdellovibrionaceae bacterium]|nr:D-glycero-beta-D-manno-heptose-7-phosphate kinase [Bdellovibrionales bacterium]USN47385.1 MAG: D-glycero-beta-D-manno-heptose-7-phosphate kinase [Pseudobdellovibrionaceae bacterium]